MANSNTVNLMLHLIQSFHYIFATFPSVHVRNAWLIQTQLIQSSTRSKSIQAFFNSKQL